MMKLSTLALLLSSTAWGASYTVQSTQTDAIKAAFPSLQIKSMFSSAEIKTLQRLHHEKTASTQLIGPVNDHDAQSFEEKFSLLFPGVKLDKNSSIEFKTIDPKTGDPLYKEQWALKNTAREVRVDVDDIRTAPLNVKAGEDLHLPNEQSLKGLKPITVAVLDTGADIEHPDLKEVLRWKKSECEALAAYLTCMTPSADPKVPAPKESACIAKVGDIDRDKNGYPMDCVGWSVVSSLSTDVLGTPDMGDELGHGTHVAGIIGAEKNNGVGVSGVSSNVRILPVRVIETPPTSPLRPQQSLDGGGEIPSPSEKNLKLAKSSVELIARGMLYAITEHVEVINMSLGWPATVNSNVIADMIKLAQEQGIAVVAAAGNDSTDALVLPCSYPGVICVGSYGPDGLRSPFSNRGPGVDFLAPGTSILSTYPLALRAHFFTDLQGYEFLSGTSMAAPMASGALAVLLGKGFSLDESLARMMAGARVNEVAVGENLKLDLESSLTIAPRPYLRAVERAPIRLTWKEKTEKMTGTFHMKNLWKNISSGTIQYRLKSSLNTVPDSVLQKNVRTFTEQRVAGSWLTGETKTFTFPIEMLGPRASRDFILEAQVTYTSESGEKFSQVIPLAVQVIPTPELVSSVLVHQSTSILGRQAGDGTMVRTLVAADAKSTLAKPEYVVMSRLKDGIGFQVLSTRNSPTYQYSGAQKLTDLTWGFLAAQRYYSQEVKDTRIAFILRKSSEITGFTQIRFDIYDGKLEKLVRSIVYDGSLAPLPENFRWTTIHGKDAMIFLANGREPPSTGGWHQVPDLNVLLRCYVLDSEGKLNEIKVNENDPDSRIVDFVPYHPEDTEKNETALLVIKGRDYRLSYYIGHYQDGAIASLQPFEIFPYRNMGFLSATPLISERGPAFGSVLSSNVGRGRMRSTLLIRESYNNISSGDFRFSPMIASEGVNRVAGGFNLPEKQAFFVQTNWDLEFHEFTGKNETVLKTSMNRFSFLPSFVSQRAFFPILVKDEKNKTEPALLSADIGSGFFNLSTIIPERDEFGKPVGMLRPALLSFEGNESGCSFIGNPVWDEKNLVYRMNSFCGDSIRSVVLQLP